MGAICNSFNYFSHFMRIETVGVSELIGVSPNFTSFLWEMKVLRFWIY